MPTSSAVETVASAAPAATGARAAPAADCGVLAAPADTAGKAVVPGAHRCPVRQAWAPRVAPVG
ncbi:PE-PGRS family protein [Mycobacterium tuberculosis]|nr:PE-PGRS family protein [Mycobacterium tuberculosis]